MTETLLNKISKYSNDTIVTNAWLTGQTGEKKPDGEGEKSNQCITLKPI